ncbi:MAG: hypothetical protein ACTJHU_11420 [Mycetocola sp.]
MTDSAQTWVTAASLLVLGGFFFRFLTVLYRNGRLAQADIMIVRRAGCVPLSVLVLILVAGLLVMGTLTTAQMGALLLAVPPVVSLCGIWFLERGIVALRRHRTTPNESSSP